MAEVKLGSSYSQRPDTRRPERLNERPKTRCPDPPRTPVSRPILGSQSLMVPSPAAVASTEPSRLNRIWLTRVVCAFHEAKLHSRLPGTGASRRLDRCQQKPTTSRRGSIRRPFPRPGIVLTIREASTAWCSASSASGKTVSVHRSSALDRSQGEEDRPLGINVEVGDRGCCEVFSRSPSETPGQRRRTRSGQRLKGPSRATRR